METIIGLICLVIITFSYNMDVRKNDEYRQSERARLIYLAETRKTQQARQYYLTRIKELEQGKSSEERR